MPPPPQESSKEIDRHRLGATLFLDSHHPVRNWDLAPPAARPDVDDNDHHTPTEVIQPAASAPA